MARATELLDSCNNSLITILPPLQLIPVSCDYKLELVLHNYQNPLHKLYNGRCCDSPSFTACYLHQCDNELFFCLRSYYLECSDNVPSTDPYLKGGRHSKLSCPEGWSNYTTGLIGYNSDNITFPVEGGWINENKRIRNPLTFTGDGQTVSEVFNVVLIEVYHWNCHNYCEESKTSLLLMFVIPLN